MEQSKKHGGKRHNSGRKPVEDKKLQVTLYIKRSHIERLGGMEEFKKGIHQYVDSLQLDLSDDLKKPIEL